MGKGKEHRAKGKEQLAEVVEIPAPIAAPAPVGIPEVQPGPGPAPIEQVPTYTLRADRRVDLLAMLLIRHVVPEEVVRAFEQYEEKHLR